MLVTNIAAIPGNSVRIFTRRPKLINFLYLGHLSMDFDDLYTKVTSSKSSKSESGLGFNIFLMQTSQIAINITVNKSFLDLNS